MLDRLPSIHRQPTTSERYKLKIHSLDAAAIYPNGDRYVVEIVDMEEVIEFGQILLAVGMGEDGQPLKPGEQPTVERRGVLPAVVMRGGNGHLLGLPDWAGHASPIDQRPVAEGTALKRSESWASVPMFFTYGDLVLIDMNAKGRNLRMVRHEYRIVNQIDILASIDGIKLQRTQDGGWEEILEGQS